MIEVEMTDDIRKYDTKLLGPFSKRQLVCSVIALAYSVPIGLLLPINGLGNRIITIFFLAVPVLSCGWFKMDGAPLEVVVMRMIYMYFLTPAKRKYIKTCTFHEAMKQMDKEEEKNRISKMSKKDQKSYEKKKKNKPFVKYSNKSEFKIYK